MDRSWQRLADHLRSELARRQWTQAELATRAGVHVDTVNDLASGRDRKRLPGSLAKIEQALSWPPGTARGILEGGELWEHEVSQDELNDSGGTTWSPPVVTKAFVPSEIAALVRHIEGLRSALERLPLADEDRGRFMRQLDEYEDELTTTLDRTVSISRIVEREAG